MKCFTTSNISPLLAEKGQEPYCVFWLPGQLSLTFNYEGSLLPSPAAGWWGLLLPWLFCHSLWLFDCP